jgi:hypothetical protein
MSVTTRQNRLLVAEDWKKVYQSFRNADFQSYDFENLRRTMIDYIRQNYPEDFNDYIESSEYLALIDLIAFLGQSIAFRVDLNARDNFLELAERRESILRLARMLSYNAKRNVAASGLLKFTSVSTTENVIDSNGRNMNGQVITWNDPSNSNWYDQFVKVLNASFGRAQQFGNPADKSSIYGIPTEQYRFQSAVSGVPVFGFTKTIAGRPMVFEVVSTTFKGQSFIYEEEPKVGNKISCIYRDDGRGPGSANTGFFMRFVQGELNSGEFTVLQPSSNESVDIEAESINNSDVWLYKLDKDGIEANSWTPVSNFEANNIIYNSVNKSIRDIYSVITRANDSISLQFSDGTFGNLPLGTFRAYYRISNGLSYTISTQDVRNVVVTFPYISGTGQQEELTITLSLSAGVSNSAQTESNEDIKANAPATYYTQNRMITGEDYNITPLSASTQIAKVKAVNRTSSGISRYFDLSDPTGKYSSTQVFADDGILYREQYQATTRFSYQNKTDIEGIIYNQIFNILKDVNLRNYFYSNFVVFIAESLDIAWKQSTVDSSTSTGYVGLDETVFKVGTFTSTDLKYLRPGSLVKFTSLNNTHFNTLKLNQVQPGPATTLGAVTELWAEVVSVVDDGTAAGKGTLSTGFGPIVLNRPIPDGARITQIIPAWRTSIDSATITTLIDLIYSNKPFGLRYDAPTQTWKIVFESNLDTKSQFGLGKQGDQSNQQQDASWLVLFTTDNEYYTITSRVQRYVFESDSQVRFYFDNSNKIYDSKTNAVIKDSINVLSSNIRPLPVIVYAYNQEGEAVSEVARASLPFTVDQPWDIVSEYVGLDGYVDTKKLVVTFADSDDNGVVDNPQLFDLLVEPSSQAIDLQDRYQIFEKYSISQGQEDYRYIDNTDKIVVILNKELDVYSYPTGLNYWNDGQYFYFVETNVVKQLRRTSTPQFVASLNYKVYFGRDKLKFQYKHNADYEARIDPGVSNIIDVFVLTKNYDTNFRQWLSGATLNKPLPPSSSELYDLVSSSLNLIKSISDEIIFHPVNYKVLFGQTASPDVQASFKVIKNSSQVVSDNDIKTRVLVAIEEFFALENWDFGDTFYFTELSTYVMTQLSPDISSFVIVPRLGGLGFGSLFEIKSATDQLFVNGATVDDIEIISGITATSIKSVAGTTQQSTVESEQNIISSTYGVNSNGRS